MRAALALGAFPRHFTGGAMAILRKATRRAATYEENRTIFRIAGVLCAASLISVFGGLFLGCCLGENGGVAMRTGMVASLVFTVLNLAVLSRREPVYVCEYGC